MIPTAPVTYTPPPPQTQPAAAAQSSPTGAEPPASPRPDLGSKAVTQAQATAKAALGVPGTREEIPEIPPDPPPVKGLGIPPLNTAQVGDLDEVPDPPRAMDDLLGALEAPAPNGLDRRL